MELEKWHTFQLSKETRIMEEPTNDSWMCLLGCVKQVARITCDGNGENSMKGSSTHTPEKTEHDRARLK